jgi:hypothetical protein
MFMPSVTGVGISWSWSTLSSVNNFWVHKLVHISATYTVFAIQDRDALIMGCSLPVKGCAMQ